MSEWKKVKLGECCYIGDGAHASLKREKEGILYITAKNISNNSIDYSNVSYISKETYNKHFKEKTNAITRPQKNDILYSIIGTIGGCILLKDETLGISSSIAIFRSKGSILSEYLYYYIKSSKFQTKIESIKGGVAQGFMSLSKLGTINIEYPSDEKKQKNIVSILSRYDSLIENYQKQIKLLEESAQRLYKEWFVDLRFPGHENTKIVDGVPEGWEKKKAQDFFNMSIGKTPPRIEKKWFTDDKDGISWVSISDMKDATFVSYTSEKLTKEACDKFNIKIIPIGTIILSFKLTVGRVAITSIPMCTNEAIAHFSKEGNNWRAYTFYYLRNYNYDSLGNTSGISKAVNSTIIKNMLFIMPSDNILDSFERHVNPYFTRINNLSNQIQLLTEARDRLLPKLMSGEIEV